MRITTREKKKVKTGIRSTYSVLCNVGHTACEDKLRGGSIDLISRGCCYCVAAEKKSVVESAALIISGSVALRGSSSSSSSPSTKKLNPQPTSSLSSTQLSSAHLPLLA